MHISYSKTSLINLKFDWKHVYLIMFVHDSRLKVHTAQLFQGWFPHCNFASFPELNCRFTSLTDKSKNEPMWHGRNLYLARQFDMLCYQTVKLESMILPVLFSTWTCAPNWQSSKNMLPLACIDNILISYLNDAYDDYHYKDRHSMRLELGVLLQRNIRVLQEWKQLLGWWCNFKDPANFSTKNKKHP